MNGYMYRAGTAGFYRYFMVAIADQEEALIAITDFLGDTDEPLESRPIPEGVIKFVGLSPGDIREWVLG
jgi:hypothetical protein